MTCAQSVALLPLPDSQTTKCETNYGPCPDPPLSGSPAPDRLLAFARGTCSADIRVGIDFEGHGVNNVHVVPIKRLASGVLIPVS
jgi:hypothetical protein